MTNDFEQLTNKAWNKKQQESYWIAEENVAQRNLLLDDKTKLQ